VIILDAREAVEDVDAGLEPNPTCSNGVVEQGKECDDGNSNNLDDCRNTCVEPFCGDGIRSDNKNTKTTIEETTI